MSSIDFPDGSYVWLGPNSVVIFEAAVMNRFGALTSARLGELAGSASYFAAPHAQFYIATTSLTFQSGGAFQINLGGERNVSVEAVALDGTLIARTVSPQEAATYRIRAGQQQSFDQFGNPLGAAQQSATPPISQSQSLAACASWDGSGGKLVTASQLAASVHIANVSQVDVTLAATATASEVMVHATGTDHGVPVTLIAIIYAAMHTARLLPLSYTIEGIPFPTAALGAITSTQVEALNPGFEVSHVYPCRGGVLFE